MPPRSVTWEPARPCQVGPTRVRPSAEWQAVQPRWEASRSPRCSGVETVEAVDEVDGGGAAETEKRFMSLTGRAGYVGVFLVGVAFAAGWSPCIGPVLAGLLTMAASGGSTLQAAGLLAAYCAGLAIPFLAAALALDRFLGWSSRMRRSWLPMAEKVSGGLVLCVGLLLVTGVFSRMASWLAA